MKLLKLSFLLILIGWAFRVSAVEQSSQPQKQHPDQPAKSEAKQASKNNQPTEKIEPPPSKSPLASPSAATDKQLAEQQGTKGNSKEAQSGWLWIAWDWMGRNTNAIFNGLLVLFSGLLWWVTRRQVALTEKAEEISRKSVDLAQLAIHTDRPFIIVEEPQLLGMYLGPKPEDGKFEDLVNDDKFPIMLEAATAELKNCGKGPAIIEDAIGNLAIVTEYPKVGDFSACKESHITRSAFAAGDVSRYVCQLYPHLSCSKETLEDIRDGRRKIIFYGRVKYRDMFEDSDAGRYETIFFYDYWIGFLGVGAFTRGSKEYNHYT